MANIIIPYETARQHIEAHAAIETQIRSGKSRRRNDDLNTFCWSYNTCVHVSFKSPDYEVSTILVATSQGVNWSSWPLEKTPEVCAAYWKARKHGKQR